MQGLLLAALILTHPLENVPVREIGCPMTGQPFSNNTVYISPIDGVVEEIIPVKNKFTIKLSNDFVEIIIPGLDCVYKSAGEKVSAGEGIGEDDAISIYTDFLYISYNETNYFPQFVNNRLFFYTGGQGMPIYSMESGIAKIAHEQGIRGNYAEITSAGERGTVRQIQYWHLLGFNLRQGDNTERGEVVGYIGNTGLSLEPHLTVSFENNFYDLRAIYIKAK